VSWDQLLRIPINGSIGGLPNGNQRDVPGEVGRGTTCALRPWHIVIVDDETTVGKSLQRLLRSAGFEADTFLSGHQFLESLSQRHPDCLILDVQMPGGLISAAGDHSGPDAVSEDLTMGPM
jgi:hypothetical protein